MFAKIVKTLWFDVLTERCIWMRTLTQGHAGSDAMICGATVMIWMYLRSQREDSALWTGHAADGRSLHPDANHDACACAQGKAYIQKSWKHNNVTLGVGKAWHPITMPCCSQTQRSSQAGFRSHRPTTYHDSSNHMCHSTLHGLHQSYNGDRG